MPSLCRWLPGALPPLGSCVVHPAVTNYISERPLRLRMSPSLFSRLLQAHSGATMVPPSPSTPIHDRGSCGYHPKQLSVLPIALCLWGLTTPLTDCSHRPPCCLSYCVSVCPPQPQSHHLSCRLWLPLSPLTPSSFPSSVPSTVLPQGHCTSHSP